MKKIITSAFIFTSFCFTAQTIEPVSEFDPVFYIGSAEANGKLFYYGTNYIETGLVITDGTNSGTNFISLTDLDIQYLYYITAFNGQVYFSASNDDGIELWVSNGTIAGTHQLIDINPNGSSYPSELIVFNNYLYFAADDGVNGEELWRTDGTVAGTVMIKDINPGFQASEITEPIIFNNELYFSGRGVEGEELWKTNGTAQGTVLVKDIHVTGESSPTDFFVHQGKLYFSATTDEYGYELYVSDGTTLGTMRISDINTGAFDASPSFFYSVGDNLFFTATTEADGYELWKYNSSNNQITFIEDFHPTNSSNAMAVGHFGNQLLVIAYTDIYEYRMFSVNVTTNSVSDFTDLNMELSGNYEMLVPKMLGNRLYFSANDGMNGRELWSTDGTILGTHKITPVINTNYDPLYYAENLVYFNSALYFSADYDGNGNKLTKVSIPNTADIATLEVSNISVFPNPASEFITIQLEGNTEIEIVDIIGNVVLKQEVNKGLSTLNVSTFEAGSYFVRTQNSTNSTKIFIHK